MLEYEIIVSVSSEPSDVLLELNKQPIKFSRDNLGNWVGTASLSLTSPVDLEFRAVGIENEPWTLSIILSTVTLPLTLPTVYKKSGTIPEDMLMILTDQITLN
jgi:hypothetical protein